jgi:hypothetical protein
VDKPRRRRDAAADVAGASATECVANDDREIFETLLLRFWRIERGSDEWKRAWLAWDAEFRLKREREIALREIRRQRRALPPDPPP